MNKRLLFIATAAFSIATLVGVPAASAQSNPSTVSISNFAFSTPEISVPAGSTVTWTNADGVQHTTSSVDGLWDSGALNGADTFSFTFNQTGDFAYVCAIHPGMHGVIHVLSA